MSRVLRVAQKAARAAAKLSKKMFGKTKLRYKDHMANAITAADKRCQDLIVRHIRKAFPASGFLGEENNLDTRTNRLNWIIDPIDGTTNFGHRVDWYAVSIAAYAKNEPIAGVILVPGTNQMFFAEKDEGAFENNRRLKLASPRPLPRAYIHYEIPHVPAARAEFERIVPAIFEHAGGLRVTGSQAIALALAASNRSDGFLATHSSEWDLAAGRLLLAEAGGMLANERGKAWQSGDTIAIGGHVTRIRELVKILKPLVRQ